MDPQRAELTRRERRKLELHDRLIETARALFAERGVAASTVAELCTRADVAEKTFFNHFPSKQDLVREIAQRAIDELLIEVETARKEGADTADRLARFFDSFAERSLQAGPLSRELVSELVHVVHDQGSPSEQARRLHDAFGAIVEDGLRARDVTRRHDAETLTEMIIGAFYVLTFNYANLENFPLKQQATAVARFLGDALAPAAKE
ncbi:MAG: TetR/AcrR family transcriptional regulator [Myxococcota bacterium]